VGALKSDRAGIFSRLRARRSPQESERTECRRFELQKRALEQDDFFLESPSCSSLLLEHDLFPKTGSHFSGIML